MYQDVLSERNVWTVYLYPTVQLPPTVALLWSKGFERCTVYRYHTGSLPYIFQFCPTGSLPYWLFSLALSSMLNLMNCSSMHWKSLYVLHWSLIDADGIWFNLKYRLQKLKKRFLQIRVTYRIKFKLPRRKIPCPAWIYQVIQGCIWPLFLYMGFVQRVKWYFTDLKVIFRWIRILILYMSNISILPLDPPLPP